MLMFACVQHYYGQEDVGKGKAPIKDVSPDLKDDDGNGLFTALPLWRELVSRSDYCLKSDMHIDPLSPRTPVPAFQV